MNVNQRIHRERERRQAKTKRGIVTFRTTGKTGRAPYRLSLCATDILCVHSDNPGQDYWAMGELRKQLVRALGSRAPRLLLLLGFDQRLTRISKDLQEELARR